MGAPRRHLGIGAAASLDRPGRPARRHDACQRRRRPSARSGRDRHDRPAQLDARGAARASSASASRPASRTSRAGASGACATRCARASALALAARLHRRRARPARSSPSRATSCSPGSRCRPLLLGIGYLPFQPRARVHRRDRPRARALRGLRRVRARRHRRPHRRWRRPHVPDGASTARCWHRRPAGVAYVAAAVWAVRYARVAPEQPRKPAVETPAGGDGVRLQGVGRDPAAAHQLPLDLFLLAAFVDARRRRPVLGRAVGDRARLDPARRARDRDLPAHRRPARGARPRRDADRGVGPATARAVRHSVMLLDAGDDHRPRARRGRRAGALRTGVHARRCGSG